MLKKMNEWLKTYIDKQNQQVWKSREIDVEKYPKAVSYLQQLTKKYPDVLTGIPVFLSNYPDMKAAATQIFIGQFWIDELEKENVKMQQLVEWTILHEAEHIHKRHMEIYMLIYFGSYFISCITALFVLMFKGNLWFADYNIYVKSIYFFLIIYFVLKIPDMFRIAYSRFIMEPQADDFANKTCRSKEAFDVVKVFISHSPQDILHPTHHSRLVKLHKAVQQYQEK